MADPFDENKISRRYIKYLSDTKLFINWLGFEGEI